jgi:hypothetical protein
VLKLVLAASAERISTVVVDGEGFRSLGLAQEVEMCVRVVNKLVNFKHTDPEGFRCTLYHGIFWWLFFKFAERFYFRIEITAGVIDWVP